MELKQMTFQMSSSLLPKLKTIKYRNKRNIDFLLSNNPTFYPTFNQQKYLSPNNSTRTNNIRLRNINSTSSMLTFKSIISKNEKEKNKIINIINSYKDKKKDNVKYNNPNIKRILFDDDKKNKFHLDFIIKNSNKIKKNSGVDTNDLLLYKSKSNRDYRPLSNNKKSKKSKHDYVSINVINEFCVSLTKRIKMKSNDNKYSKKKKKFFNNAMKRDKYAFIYLSDNPESIKYLRRVNYNPLDV